MLAWAPRRWCGLPGRLWFGGWIRGKGDFQYTNQCEIVWWWINDVGNDGLNDGKEWIGKLQSGNCLMVIRW